MNSLLSRTSAIVLALLLTVGVNVQGRAQETANQTPIGAAPAATGPDTATQTIENPPLSGLDQPSFEPGFGARSYLVPSLAISEAADTNQSGSLNNKAKTSSVRGVTRGIGRLTLQKLWKIHPLDIDYSGGADWYNGGSKVYQVHSLGAVQRILWRTGQLALRDNFSYLPQGSFGSNSFGGSGALTGGSGIGGTGIAGGGGFPGGGNVNFGSVLTQPRISNMSAADVTQSISPRSTVTLAGVYSFNDFLSNPTGYVNSQQVSGQFGFNRQLTRQDQIAVTYGYQTFSFPQQGSGSFNSNVWQVVYGHHISGRLDLQLGGGPQWIHRYPAAGSGFPASSSLSEAGRASLNYHYSASTNMNLNYSHSANAGSGLFSGANSDAIRLALTHALTRRWNVTMDSGYSYSKRILKATSTQAQNASSYHYWYAGGGLRRQLSRHVGAYATYQYDSIGFASGICTPGSGTNCNTGYGRHVGLFGLDWTPGPIRLD
jgi:hypothetical protein